MLWRVLYETGEWAHMTSGGSRCWFSKSLEVSSLVAEELFWDLEGPIVRVTTPHVPLPSADALEDAVMPSADRIVENILKLAD